MKDLDFLHDGQAVPISSQVAPSQLTSCMHHKPSTTPSAQLQHRTRMSVPPYKAATDSPPDTPSTCIRHSHTLPRWA